jgi:hypothetical protein
MKKLILLATICLSLNVLAQSSVTVKDAELYQMNYLLGVYGGEAVASTFWQIENLSYLYVNGNINDEETIGQLTNIINRLSIGNAETQKLMNTELFHDQKLQETMNTFLLLRNTLKEEAQAFSDFVRTKDESLIEIVEAKRAIVNAYFGE